MKISIKDKGGSDDGDDDDDDDDEPSDNFDGRRRINR
jgi:hypothetical protein